MYEDKKFDVRLIDRHLTYPKTHEAHITDADVKSYLEALPDCADKCAKVETKQPISSKKGDNED